MRPTYTQSAAENVAFGKKLLEIVREERPSARWTEGPIAVEQGLVRTLAVAGLKW